MGHAHRASSKERWYYLYLWQLQGVTINAALDIDQHPLPKAEEIFASLAGG